jgi:hypothetical protein
MGSRPDIESPPQPARANVETPLDATALEARKTTEQTDEYRLFFPSNMIEAADAKAVVEQVSKIAFGNPVSIDFQQTQVIQEEQKPQEILVPAMRSSSECAARRSSNCARISRS